MAATLWNITDEDDADKVAGPVASVWDPGTNVEAVELAEAYWSAENSSTDWLLTESNAVATFELAIP